MNITLYKEIFNELKEYNETNSAVNFGNEIVELAPSNPTYPLTIFDEVRNVAVKGHNKYLDKLSSLGYRVDIYAKNKGKYDKKTIARTVAQQIDKYLTHKRGLRQISWNINELENDASTYHITLMYTGILNDYRTMIY